MSRRAGEARAGPCRTSPHSSAAVARDARYGARMPRTRPLLALALAALLPLAACGDDRPAAASGAGGVPGARAAGASKLAMPETGTPTERVRTLWQRTEQILAADWASPPSFAQARAQDDALREVWISMQVWLSLEKPRPELHQEVIQQVFSALRQLYGSSYEDESKYAELVASRRGRTWEPRRSFSFLYEKLDRLP